jgi:hypothetical protein
MLLNLYFRDQALDVAKVKVVLARLYSVLTDIAPDNLDVHPFEVSYLAVQMFFVLHKLVFVMNRPVLERELNLVKAGLSDWLLKGHHEGLD